MFWILGIAALFVAPIVVLQRRGSTSGEAGHVPNVYGSGPSVTPSDFGSGAGGM